ncbi:uncharacterized protein FSUBG_7560 [Fusarium subglutinans]|uniref:Uncharacterized protein n=1 Tax=Gibberella subglutinans TaxID=42677 RepID=A0A8H5PT88_GIBSU|nr:uncharacterized protein FSUBG_7560 [Fusarium subglutinans]KAF5602685.1 hypothetical protein FSUBG_7560 [Fusarium subglutinans]
MQIPSPEPDLILPLLFICLVLVCILCTSCLILVIVVIRLTIHAQRSLPIEAKEQKDIAKGKVKEKVIEENMVAVAQNDGNIILLQVNKNYEIIFYESRTPSERIPRKKYDMNTLKIKGKSIKVNPKLPIISAVAFTHPESCGGRAQIIRVGDKDEDWNDGMDFNDKDYTICEVSGLAANVFQSTGDKKSFQIKFYYQRDDADEFADVSYNAVGVTDEWSTRPNVTEA